MTKIFSLLLMSTLFITLNTDSMYKRQKTNGDFQDQTNARFDQINQELIETQAQINQEFNNISKAITAVSDILLNRITEVNTNHEQIIQAMCEINAATSIAEIKEFAQKHSISFFNK